MPTMTANKTGANIMRSGYVFLLLWYFTGQVTAATYNSVTDFSLTENPNGVWLYESVPIGAPNSPATILPVYATYGWTDTSDTKVFATVTRYSFHPGVTVDILVTFEATETGRHEIDLSFYDDNTGGDGVIVSFWQNDTLIDSWTLLDGFADFGNSYVLDVTAGDRLSLRINNNGNDTFDGTGYRFTVTTPRGGPGCL